MPVHHHGRGDDPAGDRDDVPAAEDGVHPDPDPGGGAVAEPGPRATLRGWQVTVHSGLLPFKYFAWNWNWSRTVGLGIEFGTKLSIKIKVAVVSIYKFIFEIFSFFLHDTTGKVTFIERV